MRRGDGTPPERAFREFAIGRRIVDVQSGAMTEDGYASLLIRLDGEDDMLLTAVQVSPTDRLRWGLRTDFQVAFLTKQPRRIISPGQAL